MILQSTNPWVLAINPSESLVTTIKFVMDVEGITVGKDVIEVNNYLPIPNIPPFKISDIVLGVTQIDFDTPIPSSSSILCRRCLETGHVEEDCDTPIRSVYRCEVCDWEK